MNYCAVDEDKKDEVDLKKNPLDPLREESKEYDFDVGHKRNPTFNALKTSLKQTHKRRQVTANTLGNLATLDHEIEIVLKEGFTRGNKLSSVGTGVGFIAWLLILIGRSLPEKKKDLTTSGGSCGQYPLGVDCP